jgi:transposase
VHAVKQCQDCQSSLEQVKPNGVEKRQVFDLPPLRMQVTEHQEEIKCCPQCGNENKASFSEVVTQPVQYGPEVKSLAVYLNAYQMIPLEQVSKTIADVFGHSQTEGTVLLADREVAKQVEPVNKAVMKHLTEQEAVLHFDETGLPVNGKLHWLHLASTAQLTTYTVHAKRCHQATDEIGILLHLRGRVIHDCWKSNFRYTQTSHDLCNTHHLREMAFLEERYPQELQTEVKNLLLEMKEAVDQVRYQQSSLSPEQLTTWNDATMIGLRGACRPIAA